MKRNELTAIVMYSFSDDKTREKFMTKLVDYFSLQKETDRLDQTVWAVPYETNTQSLLKSIINELRREELEISNNDYVDLYCSAVRLNYPRTHLKYDNIIRTNIL